MCKLYESGTEYKDIRKPLLGELEDLKCLRLNSQLQQFRCTEIFFNC